MTRIVSGTAKGRRLVVPASGTRPTSARAREALFSSLSTLLDLSDARVLDLYAGTGAVGLEALSRGAAQATFVESVASTCVTLRRNIDSVGLRSGVVVNATVEAFLTHPRAEAPYGLVFADPPYALGDAVLAGVLELLCEDDHWLAPDAVVVVERPVRGGAPRWPNVIEPIRERRYGESELWYGRRR